MTDIAIDHSEEIRSKPLIELLRIAEERGVISGWTVDGACIVLRRKKSNILVSAVDAAGLLVRLMAEAAEDPDGTARK